ncbi:MAG TPA: hypothetical protein PLB75_07705 [Paludibacteraceae bacterium]|nr:hypothetical protein [Paludibacteraceae bacterium]
MERETKEIKDFDAKAFVEDCKKTLKLIDEYAMKEDLTRNQRIELSLEVNAGSEVENEQTER